MAGHGGARAGAGRPKGTGHPIKSAVWASYRYRTGLDYLVSVFNDDSAPMSERIRAAVAALPFQHARIESVSGPGVKAERQAAAEEAATGIYATPPPPPRKPN